MKPEFFIADGEDPLWAIGGSALSTDTWIHLAGVLDRTTNTSTLYVNGEAVSSKSASAIDTVSSGTTMRFGTWGANTAYWIGEIDEIRIWNTARGESDIQAAMNQSLNCAENDGLLAYYTFDDGTAADSCSKASGYDGTLYGDTTASYRGIGVDTSGSGDISGVLPAGAGTAFSVAANPVLGTLTLDESTGSFSYSPTDSSVAGTDGFSYIVSNVDGEYGNSETVTLTLSGLSLDGGTGGSSVSASDLLEQMCQNTLPEPDCTPHTYYDVGESRLDTYNGLPEFAAAGITFTQNRASGAIEADLGDVVFGMQPYDLLSGGRDGIRLSEGQFSFMANGEALFTRPALIDPCALEHLIGPFTLTDERLIEVRSVDESAFFLLRPAWYAVRTEPGEPGIDLADVPGAEGFYHVIMRFNDDDGTWEQVLHPALADRETVENALGDFVEELGNGMLRILGRNGYRFIPDYLVTHVENPDGVFRIESLGDLNGDGYPDFALIHPDGKRQELYGVE